MKDNIFELQKKYEDMINHRSYTHNLSSCEIKAWKYLGLSGIWTHDLMMKQNDTKHVYFSYHGAKSLRKQTSGPGGLTWHKNAFEWNDCNSEKQREKFAKGYNSLFVGWDDTTQPQARQSCWYIYKCTCSWGLCRLLIQESQMFQQLCFGCHSTAKCDSLNSCKIAREKYRWQVHVHSIINCK